MFLIGVLTLVAVLLVWGAVSDRRARRRGQRLRDARAMYVDRRETRRDLRAWEASVRSGGSGKDMSWMKRPRRR